MAPAARYARYGTALRHHEYPCPGCRQTVRIYEGDTYAKCPDCGYNEDIPADADIPWTR